MRQLFRLHDTITIAGNYLAMVALLVICLCFCYEVVARYVFNAPTLWANALVAYLLCVAIFLAAPNLTRVNEHVTINLLRDSLPAGVRTNFTRALRLVACAMCFFAAWFCAVETNNQYIGGIGTILEWEVPKWMVSIFIPYGFLSAGLYYLRHVIDPPAEPANDGAVA